MKRSLPTAGPPAKKFKADRIVSLTIASVELPPEYEVYTLRDLPVECTQADVVVTTKFYPSLVVLRPRNAAALQDLCNSDAYQRRYKYSMPLVVKGRHTLYVYANKKAHFRLHYILASIRLDEEGPCQ